MKNCSFAAAWTVVVALAFVAGALAQPDKPPASGGTHKQVAEITVKGAGLRHFCVAADGNIVALVGPGENYGAGGKTKQASTGEVRIYDPSGKQLKNWPVDFVGTAICVGPEGTTWVAGAGKIAAFDKDGKQLRSENSPHVAEVVKDEAALKEQAAENLKEQKQSYEEGMKQFQEQRKQLTDKDKDKQSANDKAMIQQVDQQIKAYENALKSVEKTTVDDQVKLIKTNLADIRCVAASGKDLFIATRMVKGYGYAIWRMSPDLKDPKQIVGGLSGCCGQMDVTCCQDCVFVAENSRKRVCKYDRNGKLLSTFGKDLRQEPVSGFGSCCNPMNVCFNAAGDVFTSESDGQVKRFSSDGKFIEYVGLAKVASGCKNSAIGLSPDGNKVYYIDSQKSKILVLTRDDKAADPAAGTAAKSGTDAGN